MDKKRQSSRIETYARVAQVFLDLHFCQTYEILIRLPEKAHLPFGRLTVLSKVEGLRYPRPSSLRRTSMYASFLGTSEALQLDIFQQPQKSRFFDSLYMKTKRFGRGYGDTERLYRRYGDYGKSDRDFLRQGGPSFHYSVNSGKVNRVGNVKNPG